MPRIWFSLRIGYIFKSLKSTRVQNKAKSYKSLAMQEYKRKPNPTGFTRARSQKELACSL